ncbi:MAG: AAA family ATPase [Pseudomonadales bacterium]|nr:AAA family ATPase [Pseudomonadales bacterium]
MNNSLRKYKQTGIHTENIPDLLKLHDRWVIWQAGEEKANGKFDKIPISITSGNKINALKPCNWASFDKAYNAYEEGKSDGIGIVLTDEPITTDDDGNGLYLIGVDLDGVSENIDEAKSVWKRLGTYREISPSLKGLRMLGLSRTKIKGGNAGQGKELYGSKRFLTITGISGRGNVVDATEKFLELERDWFGKPPCDNVVHLNSQKDILTDTLAGQAWPETESNVQTITSALCQISPDIPYDNWRDIIWSVASLGWSVGKDLVTEWSKQSENHWADSNSAKDAETSLTNIFNTYDRSGGIGIGTLMHHAKEHGWQYKRAVEIDDSGKEVAQPRFRLLSPRDLYDQPPMEWLIKDLLPAQGLAAIYGAPGSGKTFLALDMAIAVSEGRSTWFNRPIQQRSAIYLALEGATGIAKRIRAWEIHNQSPVENLRLVLDAFNLKYRPDVDALLDVIQQEVGDECVVFIDTLNQASPGSDENSSVDMGLLLAAAKAIHKALNGLVVLVHHSGKNPSSGLRGHSSMNGAMDTVILVNKQADGHKWKIDKSKDADGSVSESFDLASYNVGKDATGLPETSCAVVYTGPALPPRKSLNGNQKAVYEVLRPELTSVGQLSYDDAFEKAKDALPDIPTSHRADRARTALKGLIAGGHLIQDEGGISLPESPNHSPLPTPL